MPSDTKKHRESTKPKGHQTAIMFFINWSPHPSSILQLVQSQIQKASYFFSFSSLRELSSTLPASRPYVNSVHELVTNYICFLFLQMPLKVYLKQLQCNGGVNKLTESLPETLCVHHYVAFRLILRRWASLKGTGSNVWYKQSEYCDQMIAFITPT